MKRFNKITITTAIAGGAMAAMFGAGTAAADTADFDMASGGKVVPTKHVVFPKNFDVAGHSLFTANGHSLFDVAGHSLFTANGHSLFTVQAPAQQAPAS